VQRSSYLRLAHASYALGDLQATFEFNDLAAAASDDPDDAEALHLNAEAVRAWIVDGDAERAIELHGRAAAADARAGATVNQGIELFKRATLELRAGRVGAAVEDARASVRLSAAGNLRAFALGILALGLAEQGAVDEAAAAAGEAWREVEAEAPIDRIEALEAGVAVLAAAGRTSEALAVLAVADRERPATGWRRDVHIAFLLDRWRTQATRSLDPVRVGLAERAAEELSVEAAMALVLAPPPSATPGRDRHDRLGRRAPRTGLTTREVEVLALLGEGRSDGEIAAELFISPKTASVHVANIKGKLGLSSRLEIALRARELGLTAGSTIDAGGRVH
jgi:DNA-binding CsgD family transcriptional regulator